VQHGRVADGKVILISGRMAEEQAYLIEGQKFRQLPSGLWEFKQPGRIRRNNFFQGKIAEKGTDSGNAAGDGTWRVVLPVTMVQKRSDMPDVSVGWSFYILLGKKIEKEGKIGGIRAHGVIGQSSFDGQKLEELIEQREENGSGPSLGRQGERVEK